VSVLMILPSEVHFRYGPPLGFPPSHSAAVFPSYFTPLLLFCASRSLEAKDALASTLFFAVLRPSRLAGPLFLQCY